MIKIEGVEDVQKALNSVLPREASNLIRSTIHGVAKTIADDSKEFAPVDDGVLKKSIKHKREKSHPDKPTSSVYVKPQAFYWRFVNYGTGGKSPKSENPFFRRALEKARANLSSVFVEQFGKKFESFVKRQAKKK